MKIHIDRQKCIGHGVCEGLAEDLFEVGDDGQTHLLVEPLGEDRRDDVRAAIERCPARALRLDA